MLEIINKFHPLDHLCAFPVIQTKQQGQGTLSSHGMGKNGTQSCMFSCVYYGIR